MVLFHMLDSFISHNDFVCMNVVSNILESGGVNSADNAHSITAFLIICMMMFLQAGKNSDSSHPAQRFFVQYISVPVDGQGQRGAADGLAGFRIHGVKGDHRAQRVFRRGLVAPADGLARALG